MSDSSKTSRVCSQTLLIFYLGSPHIRTLSKPGVHLLLSARTAMWSVPVVLTETENENDSVNQNYVAKMTLQNDVSP